VGCGSSRLIPTTTRSEYMHACLDDGTRYGVGLERSGSMIGRDGITGGGERCGWGVLWVQCSGSNGIV